jgi:succinate dehydrogenase/fumarate reductase flavoprotein subunit
LFVDGDVYPEYFQQRRINLQKDLLEIEVSEILGGGMLLVNERCESTIGGLFGYTPAQLSLAMCGGFSSGAGAAKYAQTVSKSLEIEDGQISAAKSLLVQPLGGKTGFSWRKIEDNIRLVMSYYVGFIRNKQGMETALERLRLIESQINEIKADNYHELLRANETRHLIEYCQLLTLASLERKESGRCFYHRSDYPQLDPGYSNKHVILGREKGKPVVSLETIE